MAVLHNLGFPRIGAKRELKFAQEAFWKGNSNEADLLTIAKALRAEHWQRQSALDWAPVGEFSLYDQVLDMSFTLGNLPERIQGLPGSELDQYFRVARGRSVNKEDKHTVFAGEMTKWFDTNYHYIVPELTASTSFSLNAERLLSQINEAKAAGVNGKPVIIGPVTYLWLSKSKDNTDRLQHLPTLLAVYQQLLTKLAESGVQWVQIDEPVLVTELTSEWLDALQTSYNSFADLPIKLLLTTYFGELQNNVTTLAKLPVAGIHIDAIRAKHEVANVVEQLGAEQVLSLGVINGRNIWKTDLQAILEWLTPIHDQLGERLWLAPSCSLLHVPVDLNSEQKLDADIHSWLAFAVQKLEELQTLGAALNGDPSVAQILTANAEAVNSRHTSTRVHLASVQQAVDAVTPQDSERQSAFAHRAQTQKARIKLPVFPTTTIGSFPQTGEIRKARLAFKKGDINHSTYVDTMQTEIAYAVQQQEALDLDVLVHGEAERNDMVEYFGEQLEGYVFSQFGWVQSYGSRCVKPPIIFGDIARPQAMTVEWTKYAQSLTQKPMKGMLTGPVTMLNWSFVRDDQPRANTCQQLALAIRAEVQDLEAAGVNIIQIDEAALREGLPLRRAQWQEYLDWAVAAFRLTANGVADSTQIHTHMCYSEFNDIIESIAAMDADVITIETSRSDMELLDVFEAFDYPNDIGPGVYDIHSPNTPSEQQIVKLMHKAAERIPVERLWVNPDCGLKTRQWSEVVPALEAMVKATKTLRKEWVSEVAGT